MKQNLKQEKGRSMVEMLGVIFIIGVLTMATVNVWGYVNALFAGQRFSDTVLKSILAINGGSIHDEAGLTRFYKRYLPEYNVSGSTVLCENKKFEDDCRCTVTFTGVKDRLINRIKDDAQNEIYTASSVGSDVTITFLTNNKNYRKRKSETE